MPRLVSPKGTQDKDNVIFCLFIHISTTSKENLKWLMIKVRVNTTHLPERLKRKRLNVPSVYEDMKQPEDRLLMGVWIGYSHFEKLFGRTY